MKDKASGNDGINMEKSDSKSDDEPGIHVGDELALDPEAGDLLDPVEDRWWNEVPVKKEEETDEEVVDIAEKLSADEETLNAESEDVEKNDDFDALLPPARKKRTFKPTPKKSSSPEAVESSVKEADELEKSQLEKVEAAAEESQLRTGPALVGAEGVESDPEEVVEPAEKNIEAAPKLEKKAVVAPVLAQKKKKESPIRKTKVGDVDPETKTEKPEATEAKAGDRDPEPDASETSDSETEKADEPTAEKVEKEEPVDEELNGEPEERGKSLLEVMNENQAPVDLASAASTYAPPKRKAGCWTIFATLFFIVSLLFLAIIGIGAAIAWSKMGDLERELDTLAKQTLEQRGIYLDYEDWAYQFPRGLVLQNVTVYESAERTIASVQASDIGVNVDFVGLARDRDSISGAELSFDDSTISFFESGNAVVDLQNIDGEILIDRSEMRVERFDAEIGGLRVVATGSVAMADKGPRGESSGGGSVEASPKPFAIDFTPLKDAAKMLAIETDGEKPILSVDFEISDGPENAEIKATLNGSHFTWHGVPVTTATAACLFDPTSKTLNFTSFQVGYGEGFIGGVFTIATTEKRIDIARAQSSVDLLALYIAMKPEAKEKWSNITFADAPNVRFSGTVPIDVPETAKLSIDYEHRKGLIYKAERGDLPVTSVRGHIDLNDGRLETNDLVGDILGGQVALNGTVNLGTEGTPFSGLVEIVKLPLANASAYFGKEDIGMSGDLYLTFRGVGYSEVDRIRGGGDIRVEEATIPSFPVIGPVQEMLGRVIPMFSFEEAGAVSGTYLIESGVLLTNNFTIANNSANLLVNGSVKLAQQTTDFTAVASLNEPLAKATQLEGKTIEVRGTGPLSEPKLTLRDFPVEFAGQNLNDILGTSPETLGTLSQILAGQNNAAEVITGSIEEATGVELGETVGALLEGLISPKPEEEAEPTEPPKPVIRATVVEPE